MSIAWTAAFPAPTPPGNACTKCWCPVLTATLTIIASFLPLLILTGSVGEFISALPVTVAVALSVSFVVAILLTPLLCRFFIRQGLHSHQTDEAEGPKDHHARPAAERLQLVDRVLHAPQAAGHGAGPGGGGGGR
jgi:multidrug efflux pump subunit AcrB